MEKAKIFQSIVKGSTFFTPIVDSYHTVGNHIIELSCSEKDNQHGLYNREVNGITFKGTYGVTVITNNGNGWERIKKVLILKLLLRDVNVTRIRKLIEMQNDEIIPMLIARIKQNNIDNMVIRSKLYSLLTDITNKFDEVIRAIPRIEDFQNMSNEQVLEHYYLSVGAESLWDSRELIMKAISEQNKLIREEYENSNKG